MKFIVTILLALAFCNPSYSQAFQWAKSMGSASSDNGLAIAVDAAGNVYSTGTFDGTVDFDPGPGIFNLTAQGGFDVYVQKLDNAGNFIWAVAFGNNGTDRPINIKLDDSGNVYIWGVFEYTVDFDPGIGIANKTSAGLTDAFVEKLDNSGNFIWVKTFGGVDSEYAESCTIDSNNNVYVAGAFRGTCDFDPGPAINYLTSVDVSFWDVFISKFDANGNYLWTKQIGGLNTKHAYSMAIDQNNDLCMTGSFSGTVDFDPGIGVVNLTSPSADVFILKLTSAGNLIWVKNISGLFNRMGRSICIDQANNILIAGVFSDVTDFDPGPGVFNLTAAGIAGEWDAFILKLDANGNFVWAAKFGGPGQDSGWNVATDSIGNVYCLGGYNDTIDMDPGAGIYNLIPFGGIYNLYTVKLDANGNFQWVKSIGNGIGVFAREMTIDHNASLYITGSYKGTLDFDPGAGIYNLTANADYDAFVYKYSYCGQIYDPAFSGCDSLTLFGVTYTVSGNYIQQFTDMTGCDSTLNMQISIGPNNLNIGVTQTGATLTALATPASYQWIRCEPFQLLPGETNQVYTATANGNYAVIVTQNSCMDTSVCFPVIGIGMNEYGASSNIRFYPNPVSQKLIIEYETNFQDAIIKVLSITGQTVYEQKYITGSLIEIDMSKLVSGIYFVEITDAGKKYVRKVSRE